MVQSGWSSAVGNRYGPDLNQDFALVRSAFSQQELDDKDMWQQCCVAAVLDGHGMLGEVAARRAGQALVHDVCQRAKANGCNLLETPREKLAAYMTTAFIKAHEAALAVYDDPPATISYPCTGSQATLHTLHHAQGMPCYRAQGPPSAAYDRPLECGTTCTLAVVQGDQLCVAHVGDTSAVLVSLTDDGDVMPHLLTSDHNGRNMQEVARILTDYGDVSRISDDRGYLAVRCGVMVGHELSVTRALGHKNLGRHGVLAEPTVSLRTLRPDDACLIIASDGVWDVMDPREAANRVMDVVSSGGSAEEAARQLVHDTVMLAECSPDGDADNTTALVVVF